MINDEGPITLTYSERTCSFCKWHDKVGIRFGQFSNDYEYYCHHPDVVREDRSFGLCPCTGRYIGTAEHVPSWCPVTNRKTE